jgi:hypothetical protein
MEVRQLVNDFFSKVYQLAGVVTDLIANLKEKVTSVAITIFASLKESYNNSSIPSLFGRVEIIAASSSTMIIDLIQVLNPFREDPEKALFVASKNGDEAAVRVLLEGGTISEKALGWAIWVAASKGEEATLRILLEGRQVSQMALGHALKVAASEGKEAIVRILLEGRQVSQKDLGNAVKLATSEGKEAIVRMLLEGREISLGALIDAINCAVGKGHLEVLRTLLEGREIDEEYLGWAVQDASEKGYEAIVTMLLEGRTIDQCDLGRAIRFASEKGHEAIVRILLEGRAISQEDLGKAVECAAKKGHEGIVRILLSEGRTIAQEALFEAVWKATYLRHEGIVRFLLSEGRTITQEHLEMVFSMAISRHHEAIVQILLPYLHEIPQQRDLILRSATEGWTAVLITILERGPIDRALQESAITNAANDAIRDILRSAPRAAAGGGGAVRVAEDEFLLRLDDVEENPRVYLQSVVERGFPRRIRLLDSLDTVDLGGVVKNFVAVLIRAILDQEAFARTTEGLPLAQKEEHATCLWELGRLLSFIFKRNEDRTDKILIGRLFHERFFELAQVALAHIEEETINEEQIRRIATILKSINPDYSIFTNVILDPSDENKEVFIQAYRCDTIEEAEEGAKAVVKEYTKGVKAFLTGATREFREEIRRNEPVALLRSIQGNPVSIENLLASLECNGAGEELVKKFRWLQETIRNSSEEWRKKFVKAITGKAAIDPGTKIKIKASWREGVSFEIHTCFNSLDVPKVAMTKEDFLAALELSINSESYNIA